MIMENLKVKNYYIPNRKMGLDLDHGKSAIHELARLHALGITMKQKRPEAYEASKEPLKFIPLTADDHELDDIFEHTIRSICDDSRMTKFENRIRKSLAIYGWNAFLKIDDVEPWLTLLTAIFGLII